MLHQTTEKGAARKITIIFLYCGFLSLHKCTLSQDSDLTNKNLSEIAYSNSLWTFGTLYSMTLGPCGVVLARQSPRLMILVCHSMGDGSEVTFWKNKENNIYEFF